jgi:photosystem II stability/assembly factor-like uncharacterized protein
MKEQLILATRLGLRCFVRFNDFWEECDHALTRLEITALAPRGSTELVGTTTGVYLNRDGGKTWKHDSEGITNPYVRWAAVHPQDHRILFVGTEHTNTYTRHIDRAQWQRLEEVAKLRDENDWALPYSPHPGCVRGFAFNNQ